MFKDLSFAMVIWGIILFVVASWGVNVYKLTQLDFASPYKAEVIRGVSIFPIAPLSMITAWVEFEEEKTKTLEQEVVETIKENLISLEKRVSILENNPDLD